MNLINLGEIHLILRESFTWFDLSTIKPVKLVHATPLFFHDGWFDFYPYLGQSIQEWTKWNLWRTPFKNFEVMWSAFKFFKGCLPQISLGPFLDTLSHLFHENNAYKRTEAQKRWETKHTLSIAPVSQSSDQNKFIVHV